MLLLDGLCSRFLLWVLSWGNGIDGVLGCGILAQEVDERLFCLV